MNKNHFFISALAAWTLCAAASAEVDLLALYEKAQGGDAQAQYALGVIYYMGDGVKKDSVKAAQYFLKAAEQGDERARYFLEVVYMRGEGALPGASSGALL